VTPATRRTRPLGRKDLQQERARARGARRLLPWALVSAAGGAAIGFTAGGGVRAAAVLLAVGLSFVLFLWVTSIARCPSCGAPLPRLRPGPAEAPGVAGGGEVRSCPRCHARFE
jgi:hypothetical protein